MKTYHVAKNGQDSDSFDGDQDHPWLTAAYALKRNKAGGDTFILDDGVYPEALRNAIPSGTAQNPTTIKALNQRGVVLLPQDGLHYVIEITQPRSYIVIDGIVADGSGVLYGCYYYAVDSGEISYIVTQNGTARNAQPSGQYGPVGILVGAHANTAGHHHVSYLNMESFGHRSVNDLDGYGLYLNAHDSTVKGCRIYDCGGYTLHKYASNGGADRNVITENVFDGTGTTTDRSTVILSSGIGNKFFKNVVTGNPKGAGIDLYGGETDCDIYENQISVNANAAVRVMVESGAANRIHHNNFKENGNDGVQDDQGSSIVHDNTTWIGPDPIPPPQTKKYKIVSGEITLEEIQ